MRIGEILIDSQLISARELEEALTYSANKGVPVGRALRALKYLKEEDLNRALDAQVAIRHGLKGTMGAAVLRYAYQTNRTFLEALKAWPGTIGKEQIPQAVLDALSEKGLEQTRVKPSSAATPAQAQAQQEIASRIAQRAAALEKLQAHVTAAQPPASQGSSGTVAKPSTTQSTSGSLPKPPASQSLSGSIAKPASSDSAGSEQSAESLIAEGDRLFALNKCIPAEKSYEMALRQLEGTYGTPPSKISNVLTKLASLYVVTERYEYAEPLYKRILETQKKIFGADSPEVCKALEDLADLKAAQNKVLESRTLFEQALAIVQKQKLLDFIVAGRLLKKLAKAERFDAPSQRTRLGELAVDAELISKDQLQSALTKSRETGALLGMIFRTDNLLDAQKVESLMLAQLLIKQGTITASVAVQAIKMAVKHDMPLRQLCDAGRWITEAEGGDERYQALVVEQERLLAAESSLGPEHPEVLNILQKLADLHLVRKDRLTAEMFYKRIISTLQKSPNADKIHLARVSDKLAQTYCQQGKYADAQPLLLKSLEYRRLSGAGQSVDAAKCLWLIGKVELAQFNYATALSFLKSARTMFDKLAPGKCPRPLLEEIASCCSETGSTADLEATLELLLSDKQQGEEAKTATFMEQLADIYVNAGRREEARSLYSSSLEIYVRTASAQDKTQALSKKLAQIT